MTNSSKDRLFVTGYLRALKCWLYGFGVACLIRCLIDASLIINQEIAFMQKLGRSYWSLIHLIPSIMVDSVVLVTIQQSIAVGSLCMFGALALTSFDIESPKTYVKTAFIITGTAFVSFMLFARFARTFSFSIWSHGTNQPYYFLALGIQVFIFVAAAVFMSRKNIESWEKIEEVVDHPTEPISVGS